MILLRERTKYIFSEGELLRKDNSICFRKNGKNIYIPVEGVRELYFMGNITFNNKLVEYLNRYGIVLHMFNYYGYYSGTFYPKEKYISGKLTLQQVRSFDIKRNEIAKAFVSGIADNIYDLLYYYHKNKMWDLKDQLLYLKSGYKKLLDKSNNINQILSVEGSLWHQLYYSLRYILNEKFVFSKRVKRPPDNPVNAMISFGNMILYTKVMTQLYQTHLDQSISFLHEPMERRFSLSLDFAEAFKPVAVFKPMINLINKRQIKVEKHFEKSLNYCILNEEGRKIFIEAIENQLNSVYFNKKLNRNTTYLNSIKIDGYKFIKMLLENNEFKPFSKERAC